MRLPRLIRRVSVEKQSVLFIVERCAFFVSILRPSNQVIYVWITASSVGTREPGDVWTSVDESPVKFCRLRPPSLVQSSPFLLSPASCCCMLCFVFCAHPWVLHVFCFCFCFFRSLSLSLSSLALPGLPNLLAEPRRDLLLLVLSCPCLSSSCLWSCRCPFGSKSCTCSLLTVLGLCPAVHPSVLPPNVAHVLPCHSWLVFRGGVDGGVSGGAGGGDVESGLPSSVCLLLLVPCYKLPLVASLRLSEPSLDHRIACVALASRSVSCSFGGVRQGGTCHLGRLSLWEGAEDCRTRSFRSVARGVYIYITTIIGSVDLLYYSVHACCGDCEDEMGAIIALTYCSGLRHAGDGHYSSLPDSAAHTLVTPRPSNSTLKFGRQIDCLMQEHGLIVAKALRLPKHSAGVSWGRGRPKRRPLGLRTQRPEQQPGTPHAPLVLG